MRTSGSSLRIRGQRRGRPPTPWQHDRQQHRRWGRSALRLGVALGVVAAAIATVAHHRGELASADRLLGHLNWWWLTAAVSIEGASLMACARLRRRLLDAGGIGIGLGPAVAITLASNALSATLPAGVAWSTMFSFQQYRRRGADQALAAWVLVAAGGLSSVALLMLTLGGIGLAGRGLAASLRESALALLALLSVALLARRPDRLLKLVAFAVRCGQRLTGRSGRDADEAVHQAWSSLTTIRPRPRTWLVGLALALLNWLDDCACLAMAFLAIGSPVPWRGLLVAYATTSLLATIPITPGGLGVVEGSLAFLLVTYGTAPHRVVAAVLLYRLVSFWGLLLLGWAAFGLLRCGSRRTSSSPSRGQTMTRASSIRHQHIARSRAVATLGIHTIDDRSFPDLPGPRRHPTSRVRPK